MIQYIKLQSCWPQAGLAYLQTWTRVAKQRSKVQITCLTRAQSSINACVLKSSTLGARTDGTLCLAVPHRSYDKLQFDNLVLAGTEIPEVDSVLTSGEVQQLLEGHGQRLSDIPAAPLDAIVPSIPDSPQLYGIPGGSGEQPLPEGANKSADWCNMSMHHNQMPSRSDTKIAMQGAICSTSSG